MYVVTPSPMMQWMEDFVNDSLRFPEMVVLVPSKNLNPEESYYYQDYSNNGYRDVKANEIMDKEDQRPILKGCHKRLTQE